MKRKQQSIYYFWNKKPTSVVNSVSAANAESKSTSSDQVTVVCDAGNDEAPTVQSVPTLICETEIQEANAGSKEYSDTATPPDTQVDNQSKAAQPEPTTSAAVGTVECDLKTKLVKLSVIGDKPHQPKDAEFSKDKYGRRFIPKWFDLYPWLEWDDNVQCVTCHTCRLAKNWNKGITDGRSELTFTDAGFSFWKNAVQSFNMHENSKSHHSSVASCKNVMAGVNVLSQLSSSKLLNMKIATKCLSIIFSSLQFLSRQGVSIRSHDEDSSNFNQLIKLRIKDFPELSPWFNKKYTWRSHDIQNEILEMFSHYILRNIFKVIRQNEFFALLVDETADINQIEQLCICIRTVGDDLVVHEYFVGLHSMDNCDAQSIFDVVKDVVLRICTNFKNCRAQCYDGAATMSGRKTGLAARICDIEPRALSTHCHMHSINLSVQQTVCQNAIMRDFMSLVQDLIVFLRNSPQRRALFKRLGSQNDISQKQIRPLCPTRFTVKYWGLDSLKCICETILETLPEIIARTNDIKVKSTVSGFMKALSEFEYYI